MLGVFLTFRSRTPRQGHDRRAAWHACCDTPLYGAPKTQVKRGGYDCVQEECIPLGGLRVHHGNGDRGRTPHPDGSRHRGAERPAERCLAGLKHRRLPAHRIHLGFGVTAQETWKGFPTRPGPPCIWAPTARVLPGTLRKTRTMMRGLSRVVAGCELRVQEDGAWCVSHRLSAP